MTLPNPYLADLSAADVDRLEAAVERFELAWRRGDRPNPADYLPSDGPRLASLIELVSTDLEYRTVAGERPVGRRIGRFELLEEIGAGAFGRVYRTTDPVLGRTVAVKVPHPDRLAPAEFERVVREAKSVARLHHPGIAALYEVVEDPSGPVLVIEYVEGVQLAQWIGTRPIPVRAVTEVVAAVADALHHAHLHGVIHRDVKPSNILIDADGRPHLLDFGLAKLDAATTLTAAGDVLGTLAYMPPEQAGGQPVDARADVYGLGAVFYELLTGERLFRGDPQAVLAQLLRDDPLPPRRLNPDVPPDLETVCLRATAKRPADRYPTAAAFADDLRRWLGGRPVLARPVGPMGRWLRWARRHPLPAGLAGGLLLTGLIGLAGVGVMWHRAERRQAESEEHFRIAHAALAEFTRNPEPRFDGISEPDPILVANTRTAGKYYRELAARRPDDPLVLFQAAQVLHANGYYARRDGHPDQALDWYHDALTCWVRLRSLDPGDYRYTWGEARTWLHVALTHEKAGRPAAARDPAATACRLFAEVVAAQPESPYFQNGLRQSFTRLVLAEKGIGDPSGSVRRLKADGWLDPPAVPPSATDRVRAAGLTTHCWRLMYQCRAIGDAEGTRLATQAAEALAAVTPTAR